MINTLSYFKTHPHAALQYSRNIPPEQANKLIAYVDSNWEKERDDSKSTSSWIIFFNGAPISWYCGKQKSASTSSTEAEYKALHGCVSELMGERNLLTELGYKIDDPTVVFEDSASCIKFSENPIQDSTMRHIHPKYHTIRQLIEQGQVVVHKIDTHENIADMCTKALPPTLHSKFRAMTLKFPETSSTTAKKARL